MRCVDVVSYQQSFVLTHGLIFIDVVLLGTVSKSHLYSLMQSYKK